MERLFNGIVHLLNGICQATGFTYEEINILAYTLLIPGTWWLICWLRCRRWHVLWLLHIGAPILYYFKRKPLAAASVHFYKANTDALMWMAKEDESEYIRISIWVGVVAPALFYLALLLLPKRFVLPFYICLILGNLLWYAWVLCRF